MTTPSTSQGGTRAECQFAAILVIDVPSRTADPIRGQGDGSATCLCSQMDESKVSRFVRSNALSLLTVLATGFARDAKSGQRLSELTEKGQFVHLYRPTRSDLVALIVTNKEYNERQAQAILGKMMDEFRTKFGVRADAKDHGPYDFNKSLLVYMDEVRANKRDAIAEVQQQLDETTILVQKSVESIMERGEKLSSLVEKSDQLGMQSKMFYTASKKQNSCCVVM